MARKILRLTAHYLEEYEACPLNYNRVVNLQVGEQSKPSNLARGLAIHELLADYYRGVKDKIDFNDNVTNAIKHFEVSAMSINGLLVEDIDNCIKVFHEYTEFYQDRDRFEILAVEETLSKVLYEDDDYTILWEGTQDMITSRSDTVVLVDHKSEKSKITPSQLSNQFMGYCVLAGQNRIERNAVGFQTTKKPVEKFYRTMFSYSNANLNWWIKETLKKAAKIFESYEKDEWVPNFYACDNLHRRGCGFRTVCIEDESMWEGILEKDFIHVELYDRKKLKGKVFET